MRVSRDRLKNVETHFAFGRNWASYAGLVGEAEIEQAKEGLLRLIPPSEIVGRSFLDIGCGSGVHSLAAVQLGVNRLMAVDIDPNSAATTHAMLSESKIGVPWQVETMSAFDLDPRKLGTFDVVYSWGVLHHTGSLWEAIGKAAAMVAPNGLLAIALYRSTYLDPFWKWEKRVYAHAPAIVQRAVRAIYLVAFRLRTLSTGRSFRDLVATYRSHRGMDFYHDVHDWLGGSPYETTLAPEVDAKLTDLGFRMERSFVQPKSIGLFGSGCDEYVYRLEKPF